MITSKTVLQSSAGIGSPSTSLNSSTDSGTALAENPYLPNLEDYKVAEEKIQTLKRLASTNEEDAITRRNLRHVEVDVKTERDNGGLKADEVYTPVRLANQNIEREQGKYVAYLKQPQRAAFFYCTENPALSTELLAADFTKKFRYNGWEIPMFANVDRFQTHGWSVVEVQYDVTKPGRFYNDDVPFEDFLAPQEFRDLQQCEMLGRRYPKTKTQLYEMVQTHQFNEEQVRKVCDGEAAAQGEQILHKIEKIFFRKNNIVMVGWSCEGKCDDWLREPRPLHIGVVEVNVEQDEGGGGVTPVFESNYPFVVFPYKINENKNIVELKGRVFYDEYQQEAATSLQSSYCTAHRRSSAPYFSRDDDNPGADQVQNVTITPGVIISAKVKPFQLTAPDASMLSAIQALITQSSQESGNINYAANNRVDSRKTATEIQSAQAENALLATTQTALFSSSMAQLLEMDWRIFSSQAAAGLIPISVSREYYLLHYVITPAGDVEVVARQEKLNNMKQTWPVIQNTGIAMEFLKRMLMLMFPEDALVYNSMLIEDQQKMQLITQLWQLIIAFSLDPMTNELEPEVAPYLTQLQQLGQMVATITGTPSPFDNIKPSKESGSENNEQTNFDSGYKPQAAA